MVTSLRVTPSSQTDSMHKMKPSRKKMILIINFRGQPIVGGEFIDRTLMKLSINMNELLGDEEPKVSLEEMYRSVENLMQFEQRQAIFDIFNVSNKEFLCKKLQELLLLNHIDDFFDFLISMWFAYCKKVVLMKNIFLHYDRSRNDYKFNTIQTTCMELFKNVLLLNEEVSSKITSHLIKTIFEDRFGIIIDKETIGLILSLLMELKVYEAMFEQPFLKESEQYFRNEAGNISDKTMNVRTYLHYLLRKISEEEARFYIFPTTRANVLSILYRETIEKQLEEILTQGFQQLMDDNDLQTLKLMYSFFSEVPEGINSILEYFQKYVDNLCYIIVTDGVDKQMIQELIDLKDRLDEIIRDCFKQNKVFYDGTKTIFDKTINMRNTESALYLAKYLDMKLRSKNISEKELEDVLNKAMVMFRFIHGKDIFEAFYRKDLAKRLIFGRSTNQDLEQSIIIKLKEECGESFTNKIEGMLNDIHLSLTINSNFRDFVTHTHPGLLEKSEVYISVLTSSFWTTPRGNLRIAIPDELLNYQDVFLKYYVSIHTGRKLDWQAHLDHCVLRGNFGSSTKELLVSLFQTIVLLLFNDNDKLTTVNIQKFTKLETKDLIPTLHSLSCGKVRVLLKDPPGNTIAMDDNFTCNDNFTDKLFRIKINQAQLKETVEELKATEKSVLADRQFQIDAAIVRILKSRKIVKHNELLGELFKVLDIPVKPQDLKKRIELLIDREYIKRDFNNAATYTYVA